MTENPVERGRQLNLIMLISAHEEIPRWRHGESAALTVRLIGIDGSVRWETMLEPHPR